VSFLERPLFCGTCAVRYFDGPERWRCDCGGFLEVDETVQGALPFSEEIVERITLGGDLTPLLEFSSSPAVWLKCDHLLPTGSYKDRGTLFLVAHAISLGQDRVVIDSSGNAGASLAAHAARVGLSCDVFVRTTTSSAKLEQISAYGAVIHKVDGERDAVARAAQVYAAATGAMYVSHNYDPYFVHGIKTWAFELWEQCGKRLPATVVLPVGAGSLLRGAWLGFRELQAASLTTSTPRIVAVQEEGCSPVARAFHNDLSMATDVETGRVAEGIANSRPPRLAEITSIIRESGGTVVVASGEQIMKAQRQLGLAGIYAEPTGSVALAGWQLLKDNQIEDAAVAVTGAGWKAQ
jgi:threonine synthase